MKKTLSVAAIEEGTVIDHIPPGFAMVILDLLKLGKNKERISIGLNLPSSAFEKKDLIKVENRFLSPKEIHDIAVFAPHATINIIRNFQVEEKIAATLPEAVENLLFCPNRGCITNAESLTTLFFVEELRKRVHLRCKFCEQLSPLESLRGQYK